MPRLLQVQRTRGVPALGPGVAVPVAAATAPGRALAAGAQGVGEAVFKAGIIRKHAREKELNRLQRLANASKSTIAFSTVTRGLAEIEDAGAPLAPDFVDRQDREIGKLIDETIRKIPRRPDGHPLISPEALGVLRERTTKLRDAAYVRSLKRARGAAEKEGADAVTGSAKGVVSLIRRRPGALVRGLTALDGLFEDFSGTLSADGLRDLKADSRADAVSAAVRGFVDQDNFPAARGVLADTDFDRDLPEKTRNTLTNEVDAAEKGARLGAKKFIKSVAEVFKAGETPPPDQVREALRASAPFPDLNADLIRAERLGEFARELRRQPPVVMQNVINKLHGQKTKTAEDLERLGVAKKILANAKTELENDPLSYGARSGVVELAPLDPQDPESVRQRITAAAKVEGVYGVEVPPFTDEEIADTVRAYKNADATGQLAILRGLVDMNMPDAMLDDALNALNDRAPAMALVADLVTRDLVTARDVLLGQEFLKNNPGQAPQKIDVDNELDATLGDALRADETGRTRAAVVAAANGFYVQSRIGEEPGFDTDAYGAAIEAVVGTVVERNGQHTIVPPGMTEDQFDDAIDGLTDEALHPIAGLDPGEVPPDVPLGPHRLTVDGLTEVTAEEIKEDGRLITVGRGRYSVAFAVDREGLFTGDDLEFTVDAAGDPYVLDLNEGKR